MLLKPIFEKFIQIGTLQVTDAAGKKYTFTGKPGPQAAICLHTKQVEWHLLWNADIGLGEGYMDGAITIEQGSLYDFLDICMLNLRLNQFGLINRIANSLLYPFRYYFQYNPRPKAQKNIAHHYDLSAQLYNLFLDKDRQYSCAYFIHPDDSLDTAQENKKRHLAAKLRLQPGQKILDIGSGWGGLALYLARHLDVDVTGLTLSKEQLKIANERAKQEGLDHRVRFYLRDYREETGQYDRIVSVGMFEHVGVPFYKQFFQQINQLLTPDGLAVLHAIGRSTPPENRKGWMQKYIFPGGYCPSLSEVLKNVEPSKLFITDIELLRHHYDKTLHHWHARFQAHRQEAQALYGEKFCRMWEFYLVSCELAFRDLGYYVFQIQLVRDLDTTPATRDYITQWENHQHVSPAKLVLHDEVAV